MEHIISHLDRPEMQEILDGLDRAAKERDKFDQDPANFRDLRDPAGLAGSYENSKVVDGQQWQAILSSKGVLSGLIAERDACVKLVKKIEAKLAGRKGLLATLRDLATGAPVQVPVGEHAQYLERAQRKLNDLESRVTHETNQLASLERQFKAQKDGIAAWLEYRPRPWCKTNKELIAEWKEERDLAREIRNL